MNNLQIYIRGVHIRFEDSTTNIDSPRALGLCIQSISLETTNRLTHFEIFLLGKWGILLLWKQKKIFFYIFLLKMNIQIEKN